LGCQAEFGFGNFAAVDALQMVVYRVVAEESKDNGGAGR